MTFFDVDGTAGDGGSDQQVSLAAEECGDLKNGFDVAKGFGELGGLLRRVNVCEDRKCVALADSTKDASAFVQTGAPEAVNRGAVRLVVAGLEDVRDAQVRGDALDGVGEGPRVGFAFDDAGTRDEEEGRAACDDGSDVEFLRMAHAAIGA